MFVQLDAKLNPAGIGPTVYMHIEPEVRTQLPPFEPEPAIPAKNVNKRESLAEVSFLLLQLETAKTAANSRTNIDLNFIFTPRDYFPKIFAYLIRRKIRKKASVFLSYFKNYSHQYLKSAEEEFLHNF